MGDRGPLSSQWAYIFFAQLLERGARLKHIFLPCISPFSNWFSFCSRLFYYFQLLLLFDLLFLLFKVSVKKKKTQIGKSKRPLAFITARKKSPLLPSPERRRPEPPLPGGVQARRGNRDRWLGEKRQRLCFAALGPAVINSSQLSIRTT